MDFALVLTFPHISKVFFMKESKKHNHQIEINDLIDDAITNAITRRGLLTVSDDEAASISGGLAKGIVFEESKLIKPICPPPKPIHEPNVAGFKPVVPICPPPKPIHPPIVVGLIALPDDKNIA
jgi:hypothetical protein